MKKPAQWAGFFYLREVEKRVRAEDRGRLTGSGRAVGLNGRA
jgi:hypothetical protein